MPKQMTEKRTRGRPRLDRQDTDLGTVRSLDRGIQLLRVLAKEGDLTLTDLALRVGLPISTAHRLLATMQQNDIVGFREATQEWCIGVEAFRIGSAFAARNTIVEAGFAVMRRLVDETGETANIAISEDQHVVFLSQVETPNPIRAFFPPGTRAPMHASGIGKMLLAELDRSEVEQILLNVGLSEFTPKTLTAPQDLFDELDTIRRRGWSLDDEERYSGMRCIAAPIYNPKGVAIAGISISGPTVRLSDDAAPEMAAKVRNAAAEVTARTGGLAREMAAV